MDALKTEAGQKFEKAINDLVEEFIPSLKKTLSKAQEEDKEDMEDEKKAKGKAEDEEKEEKEEEKKAKGKAEEDEEDDKNGKSKGKADEYEEKEEDAEKSLASKGLSKKAIDWLNKAVEKEEKMKEQTSLEKSLSKFSDLLTGLREDISKMAKSPARMRKSSVTDYEVIEKSKNKEDKLELTQGEVLDTMDEMVKKGEISSIHVCEFNGTKDISDPMIKSRVISKIREKRGLRG